MQVKLRLLYLVPETKKIAKYLNVRVCSKKNKESSQVRYLGVILQDNLHWDTHLEKNILSKP